MKNYVWNGKKGLSKRAFNYTKTITLSMASLQDILKGRVKITNLPKDFFIERINYDVMSDRLQIIIWSESFPIVAWGEQSPNYELVFHVRSKDNEQT